MTTAADMDSLKSRLKSMWMAGDYGHFAKFLEPGALEFLDAMHIQAGQRVLDIACGAGQLSLPAARRGAQVIGVDIATNLIEQARARSASEGPAVQFDEGDVEALPYADAGFDVVFSLIGAMFAPRPELVVAEMLRVCRPGGRVVMGNWTPEGFIGQMFKLNGKHVPPPAGMPSPVLWGNEATVRERFTAGVAALTLTRRMYVIRYPFAPSEVVEFFRTYYGPTNRAFAALDGDKQQALRHDLECLWSEHNQAQDGGTEIAAEYLHVEAVRGSSPDSKPAS